MTGLGAMTPLRRICLSKGVSRRQLAEKAGLSRQTLYNIEAGQGFSDETIFKLADALEMDAVELAETLGGNLDGQAAA